jgi:Mrp family chromosome partitioning ATPase
MDKIRKALDLARLERSLPGESSLSAEAPIVAAASVSPLRALPTSIVYTRTRAYSPSAELLESNRIINPASAHAEAAAFRMLRTQVLQRMDAQGWRTLAIFSPRADDGKTTTAINLAINLANDHHHTVLLVDFDFKRPSVAAKFGLAPDVGVDDALCGTAKIEDCLYHPEGFDRLVLLPARGTLEHTSEILAGPRTRDLVAELRRRYAERVVVFDLPPVLAADDALAFAPLVECGLVVAAEGRTRRAELVRTIELLHKTTLVGTVLNRAAEAAGGY